VQKIFAGNSEIITIGQSKRFDCILDCCPEASHIEHDAQRMNGQHEFEINERDIE